MAKKKISNPIDKYFNPSIFIKFVVLLVMPIVNGWITEHYATSTTMFCLIITLFLFVLIAFLIILKEKPNTFTSIFMLYLTVEATMPYKEWAIPIFSAYVVFIASHLNEPHEEKKKK